MNISLEADNQARGRNWYELTCDQSLSELDTSWQGLTTAAARARLQTAGPNRLAEIGGETRLRVLARQFTSPLILVLVVAAAVSFGVGEVVDGGAILGIVVLNGVLGYLQEWKAQRAIDALRRLLNPMARVLRDGDDQRIPAEEVVPGDILVLEAGARVPADCRLLEVQSLAVDESALTGESVSIDKGTKPLSGALPIAERSNLAFMGTVVTAGRARAVTIATGMDTEMGHIARITESIEQDQTPLQRRLGVLGRQLGLFALGISAAVAVLGVVTGRALLEMFLTAVALAVAAIPEGLPAVVTLTLAMGVRQMVRRHALIRRLSASEGLGSASVICTDKTGTLTENQMTVTQIRTARRRYRVSGSGYAPEGSIQPLDDSAGPADDADLRLLLDVCVRCNAASLRKEGELWTVVGEPTEGALLTLAAKRADSPERSRDGSTVAEIPFSSRRKRMTVVLERDDRWVAYVKGAPDILLDRCSYVMEDGTVAPLTEHRRQSILAAHGDLANAGLRTLAMATREVDAGTALDDGIESDLTWVGEVGMVDAPRAEVAGAIRVAHAAGIDVVMVTGDATPTAVAIAEKVGIPHAHALTGTELARMTDVELLDALGTVKVLARVSPEDKLRVVSLLQGRGEVVAVTGDGVNDTPALRKADIGVAMGLRGTDVAKGAADMVLTDDNFASIVGAVEEGRRQYDNIQKFVRYLMCCNAGEVVAVAGAIFLGLPLILLPVQILWMNLVTDSVLALALGLEGRERDVMLRVPRSPSAGILSAPAIATLLAIGLYMGAASVFLFNDGLRAGAADDTARTLALTCLVVFQVIVVFNFRSLRAPTHQLGLVANRYLVGAMGFTLLLQAAAVYAPPLQAMLHTTALGARDWAVIAAITLPLFIAIEALKARRAARAARRPLASV